MEKSSLQNYLGIPVLVQLKQPLIGVTIGGYQRLRFATDPSTPQWVPIPLVRGDRIEVTQVVQVATLSEVEGSDTMLEILWEMPRLNATDRETVLGTLIGMDDILAVTRIHSVSEVSPLIIKG